MIRALFVAASVGGLAVAAPVPKTAPAPAPQTPANLTLGTAALNNGMMRITYTAPPFASAARVNLPRQLTTSVQLESVKVTTADGKELTGDDLAKKLAESSAVARSTTAIDPEWKKFFADDVLFVEPSGKPAVGVGVGVGGGAVIRPLPIRPALPRLPIEEPPVEKKDEKKEEKKEEKK